MAGASVRPTYGAIPARAFGDKRLTGEYFRVLGVIALHDRMGVSTYGCYAAPKRLAVLADCHVKSLPRTIQRLAEYGYIRLDRNPMKGVRYTMRVIYNEFDDHYFAGRLSDGLESSKVVTFPSDVGNKAATGR